MSDERKTGRDGPAQPHRTNDPRPRPTDGQRQKRCCENCVYATRPAGKWLRFALAPYTGLLICANSAEAPGELRGVPPCSACANFRAKRPPVERTAPPAPPADGAFRYIPLTQGEHALVDIEDYERLRRHRWCLSRSGSRLYAQRRVRGRTLRMHVFLMDPPPGMVVDHIDGNGLNNRRCNLRICTRLQNAWNHRRTKRDKASSRYMGVHRYKNRPDKWYVKIQRAGAGTNLGPFDSEIEAARARDRLAVKLFGEYAGLNLPEEWPPERRKAVIAGARSRAHEVQIAGAQDTRDSSSDMDLHG